MGDSREARMVEAVLALHEIDVLIQCGARGTAMVSHGYERGFEEVRLCCTEPQGHDPHWHKDNIHCYTTHVFDEVLVDEYRPRDFSTCKGCGRRWPCDTIRAMEEA